MNTYLAAFHGVCAVATAAFAFSFYRNIGWWRNKFDEVTDIKTRTNSPVLISQTIELQKDCVAGIRRNKWNTAIGLFFVVFNLAAVWWNLR